VTHRRYRQDLRRLTLRLTPSTHDALSALVPAGARATFVEAALRVALAREAQLRGLGASPAVQLAGIAALLRELAADVDRHASKWGE